MRFAAAHAAIIALWTAASPICAQPASPAAASPWNGDWVISRSRNPQAIFGMAADDYRFTIAADGHIRWEIPSLHEVVEGRTDGRPMTIRRPDSSGMTLAVTAEGSHVLHYVVAKDGEPKGEGRMTLVEDGQTWVDITQPFSRPDLAHVVIYVRPAAATAR